MAMENQYEERIAEIELQNALLLGGLPRLLEEAKKQRQKYRQERDQYKEIIHIVYINSSNVLDTTIQANQEMHIRLETVKRSYIVPPMGYLLDAIQRQEIHISERRDRAIGIQPAVDLDVDRNPRDMLWFAINNFEIITLYKTAIYLIENYLRGANHPSVIAWYIRQECRKSNFDRDKLRKLVNALGKDAIRDQISVPERSLSHDVLLDAICHVANYETNYKNEYKDQIKLSPAQYATRNGIGGENFRWYQKYFRNLEKLADSVPADFKDYLKEESE